MDVNSRSSGRGRLPRIYGWMDGLGSVSRVKEVLLLLHEQSKYKLTSTVLSQDTLPRGCLELVPMYVCFEIKGGCACVVVLAD